MSSHKCVSCGKDIGMDIEFGGNPQVRPCTIDGDGFVCSDACMTSYEAEVKRGLDELCDPKTNLADWLGLPQCYRPYGGLATS